MDYVVFGKRLRDERLKLHLTQEKLAKEVNLSTAYIGQIERGERSLTLDNLEIVANRLGTSIDYLVSESLKNKDENTDKLWLQLMENCSEEEKRLAMEVGEAIINILDKEKIDYTKQNDNM